MRIAVAGGTGHVGRHVVDAVRAAGHEPVVLSRSEGVDLTTGAGLDAALDGASAVIDVANITSINEAKATSFFETTSRALLDAGKRAGVAHHVTLSIVSMERVAYPYYTAKLAQERVVLESGGPVSVLRATQFHEFAGQVLERIPGPIKIVPKARIQPVAAREVGAALVSLALGAPQGRATDLAGPREESLPDMARKTLRAAGKSAPVLSIRLPGKAGKQMAAGMQMPDGPATLGTLTFDEWLVGPDGPAAQR